MRGPAGRKTLHSPLSSSLHRRPPRGPRLLLHRLHDRRPASDGRGRLRCPLRPGLLFGRQVWALRAVRGEFWGRRHGETKGERGREDALARDDGGQRERERERKGERARRARGSRKKERKGGAAAVVRAATVAKRPAPLHRATPSSHSLSPISSHLRTTSTARAGPRTRPSRWPARSRRR